MIRATDFSLTHSEYRIGSGSACRAKPMRGAASEMSPSPTLLPCPAGQPPLKLTGAARAPGAANVISPSEGVHAVSAQQCGFGRGVASGPQVSVALPALRPVAANREHCGCCGGSCCGGSGLKAPLDQCCGGVAVPRGGRETELTGGVRTAEAGSAQLFIARGARRHRHTF